MANLIDIIIRANWQGRTQVQQAQRDLKGVDTATVATGRSSLDLAKALTTAGIAFGATAVAARQLWRALEEGAGLELTAQRFDRLALSIGSTGDALRRDLQEATSGMMSNAQAMALATNLIALDLTNSHDETVRWSRAISELNMDIGELVLALSNQTTRRFDQLNVSVAGFDEKLQALKGTMSDEQAFAMAFLQQAEEQIEKVGGAADTARGDLLRLQADWRKLDEDFKLWLVGAVGPTLNIASGRAGTDISERVGALASEAESVDDLAAAYEALRQVQDAIARMSVLDRAAFVLAGGMQELENAELAIISAVARVSGSAEEFQANLRRVFTDKSYLDALGLQRDTLGALAPIYDRLTEEIKLNAAAQEEKRRRLDDTTEATERLTQAIGAQIASERRLAAASAAVIQASKGKIDAYLQETAALRSLSDISEQVGNRKLEGLELTADRAELWADFQDDVTDITARAEEQRRDLTESYEQQRTELVASQGAARLQAERDLQRQHNRQNQRLEQDIAKVRASTNKDIEKLTADHTKRIKEIIDNANFSLSEAASRLDAKAVAQIQRQRDKAIADERAGYQERVQAARDAEKERIDALREANAERQRIEREDLAERLDLMDKANEEALKKFDDQHKARLKQIDTQAEKDRQARERQYQKDYYQLGGYWGTRQQIEAGYQRQAITAMENYWRSHIAIINGSAIGGIGITGGGGTTSGGGTTGNRPSRDQLMQIAIAQMQAAGWSPQVIGANVANSNSMLRRMTDEQLARWLEQTFGIDIPGYLMGIDRVPRTGLALLHEGERVIPAPRAGRQREGRASIGDVTINVNGASSPQDTAREVRKEFKKLVREMAA